MVARRISIAVLLLCVLSLLLPAGEPVKPPDGAGEREIDSKKVDAAVKKAVAFIRKHQEKDGSWKFPGVSEDRYPMGVTAFAAFALIKGGVKRNDPAVIRALTYISKQQFKKVYSISVCILLLEALYTPPPPKDKKKLEKYIILGQANIAAQAWRQYAPQSHKKLLKEAAGWLVSKQEPKKKLWRYPEVYTDEPCPEDASNAQYAMLALAVARRLGYRDIPDKLYFKVIDWFLENQEKDGPEIPYFPVPGADKSIRELLKHAAKIRKALKKKKKNQTAEEIIEQAEPLYRTNETFPMKARGWGYSAPGVLPEIGFDTVSGSMTASGICCLMIAKEALGGKLRGKKAEAVDQAMRDGFAWLRKNWTVSRNPCKPRYEYYYLYSVERACQLTLTQHIAEHDWYGEGAKHLLAIQNADGSWNKTQHLSALTNTCFGILFLKRATTPVLNVPSVTFTGDYLKKKQDKKKKNKK